MRFIHPLQHQLRSELLDANGMPREPDTARLTGLLIHANQTPSEGNELSVERPRGTSAVRSIRLGLPRWLVTGRVGGRCVRLRPWRRRGGTPGRVGSLRNVAARQN